MKSLTSFVLVFFILISSAFAGEITIEKNSDDGSFTIISRETIGKIPPIEENLNILVKEMEEKLAELYTGEISEFTVPKKPILLDVKMFPIPFAYYNIPQRRVIWTGKKFLPEDAGTKEKRTYAPAYVTIAVMFCLLFVSMVSFSKCEKKTDLLLFYGTLALVIFISWSIDWLFAQKGFLGVAITIFLCVFTFFSSERATGNIVVGGIAGLISSTVSIITIGFLVSEISFGEIILFLLIIIGIPYFLALFVYKLR